MHFRRSSSRAAAQACPSPELPEPSVSKRSKASLISCFCSSLGSVKIDNDRLGLRPTIRYAMLCLYILGGCYKLPATCSAHIMLVQECTNHPLCAPKTLPRGCDKLYRNAGYDGPTTQQPLAGHWVQGMFISQIPSKSLTGLLRQTIYTSTLQQAVS